MLTLTATVQTFIDMNKKIKVKYLKLGRENIWGLAHCGLNLIELDIRLKGKKHLEILTHESLHILLPELEEEDIVKLSVILTKTLWSEGYRKIDNNNDMQLQDGSK